MASSLVKPVGEYVIPARGGNPGAFKKLVLSGLPPPTESFGGRLRGNDESVVRKRALQHASDVDRFALRAVANLVAAARAVRDDERVRTGLAHARQQ